MQDHLLLSNKELERNARQSLCEWVSAVPWDWYVTNTFASDGFSLKKSEALWYKWFQSIRAGHVIAGIGIQPGNHSRAMYGSGAPYYFKVAERTKQDRWHFHALIGNVSEQRRLYFKDLWESCGFARVMAYDPDRGAAGYLAKYLTKDLDHGEVFTFSRNIRPHLPIL